MPGPTDLASPSGPRAETSRLAPLPPSESSCAAPGFTRGSSLPVTMPGPADLAPPSGLHAEKNRVSPVTMLGPADLSSPSRPSEEKSHLLPSPPSESSCPAPGFRRSSSVPATMLGPADLASPSRLRAKNLASHGRPRASRPARRQASEGALMCLRRCSGPRTLHLLLGSVQKNRASHRRP